jgi:uroporphyrinogen-III synthase
MCRGDGAAVSAERDAPPGPAAGPAPGAGPAPARLAGLRVGVTAGRRGDELVAALTRLGARVLWAPTVAVVPATPSALEHQTAAVLAARPDWVIVTTAEGLDRWVAGAGPLRAAVLAALAGAEVAARGMKAAGACRRHGVRSVLTSPAERGVELARLVVARARPGARVALLADGNGSPAVRAELAGAGLTVDVVTPYRWAVPAPAGPGGDGGAAAGDLLRAVCAGEIDALAFTSPPAVDGLFAVAGALGLEAAVQDALAGTVGGRRIVVAAIGPATAEALEERGAGVAICPLQPRMAALAGALAAAPLGLPPSTRFGPLLLDGRTRSVTGPAGSVELSELQFALTASLARRPGTTCPTGVLLREVWGAGAPPGGTAARRRLEVLASRLRGRLAEIGVDVVAAPKRGYRLEAGGRPAAPSSVSPGARPVD